MTDTLLFVEDDASIRDMATDFLGEAGLNVLAAENADVALDVLDRHADKIGVLFTDIRMPGSLDGLALARLAPVRWPWINIIVTSGLGPRSIGEIPGTFIQKPWLPLDMLTTVMRAAAASSAPGADRHVF